MGKPGDNPPRMSNERWIIRLSCKSCYVWQSGTEDPLMSMASSRTDCFLFGGSITL